MPISYVRPESIAAAATLAAAGGRILAGGQSLMPLVNCGDVDDVALIDINRLAGLDRIVRRGDGLEIGALVRLETVRTDPLIAACQPLIAAALDWVANPAIRLRGTLVGNLVQNGPGAEAMAAAALAGARLVTADGAEYPLGSLPPGTFATHVRLAAEPPHRAGFYEVQRRFGHLGTVGCGVTMTDGGEFRVVFSGLLAAPFIAPDVAAALAAGRRDDAGLGEAIERDLDGRVPLSDIHATARYRRDVAPAVVRRALQRSEAGA